MKTVKKLTTNPHLHPSPMVPMKKSKKAHLEALKKAREERARRRAQTPLPQPVFPSEDPLPAFRPPPAPRKAPSPPLDLSQLKARRLEYDSDETQPEEPETPVPSPMIPPRKCFTRGVGPQNFNLDPTFDPDVDEIPICVPRDPPDFLDKAMTDGLPHFFHLVFHCELSSEAPMQNCSTKRLNPTLNIPLLKLHAYERGLALGFQLARVCITVYCTGQQCTNWIMDLSKENANNRSHCGRWHKPINHLLKTHFDDVFCLRSKLVCYYVTDGLPLHIPVWYHCFGYESTMQRYLPAMNVQVFN